MNQLLAKIFSILVFVLASVRRDKEKQYISPTLYCTFALVKIEKVQFTDQ